MTMTKHTNHFIYALIPDILKVFLAIAIAGTLISIIGARITKMEVTLNEKKAMTIALQKRSETTVALRNAFAVIGDSDRRIADAFPATENVLDFVTATETLGNQNSMQQTIRFDAPGQPIVETESITIIPVKYTITANGTITTLANYARQFEELSYFVGIRSITISTGSQKGWEDSSTITIQGTLYTKKI
ncbi:hypothetical protein A2524_01310 [Candidatus Wolfebacteria bacterium RIFOXYD12_FULL_48_21]|uniref:Type 4 fimbrial biogenesis protein PilO n=1 Tax=Candidatus Wolfebacteria bacterium RIFOXYD1_FULL_48_65 TaxID=1802561 RepID=A0A1F8DYS2_9BACT|nr:MAG: hypothetical protein A2610_00495 [Candidatus Wolfebacteria bacterium RIFOXYD1_FULL_48_65]OGM94446.1 MAG: hypothetical protein A2524_01310 [Candidatus Wolfebacteria bacterium RIFOXYD12_FULL_48_21]OGM97162.1 MAG: hypothetical protein A2532_01965 [Candidatus Wolfebacteria bacterium RIFOXYD2_FULL_48_11]